MLADSKMLKASIVVQASKAGGWSYLAREALEEEEVEEEIATATEGLPVPEAVA